MSRGAVFFLVVVTLGLAILLSFLGLATLCSNLLGWFLLVSGLVYFFGVVVVYWIRGIRFWRPRAMGETVREERDDWSFWFIVVGMVTAFYLPPVEYLFLPAVLLHSIWMEGIGLLMIFLGSVLFIWARRALGHSYSGHLSVVRGQRLVQSGPYRVIRHPAYAGYVLIVLGLALGYSSLAGFASILLVLLPSVIYRIRVEDKLLAEQFEAEFEDYACRTRRLIPGLW